MPKKDPALKAFRDSRSGLPGTGKSRAALSLALKLGQPLYQVDYSAVVSNRHELPHSEAAIPEGGTSR